MRYWDDRATYPQPTILLVLCTQSWNLGLRQCHQTQKCTLILVALYFWSSGYLSPTQHSAIWSSGYVARTWSSSTYENLKPAAVGRAWRPFHRSAAVVHPYPTIADCLPANRNSCLFMLVCFRWYGDGRPTKLAPNRAPGGLEHFEAMADAGPAPVNSPCGPVAFQRHIKVRRQVHYCTFVNAVARKSKIELRSNLAHDLI